MKAQRVLSVTNIRHDRVRDARRCLAEIHAPPKWPRAALAAQLRHVDIRDTLRESRRHWSMGPRRIFFGWRIYSMGTPNCVQGAGEGAWRAPDPPTQH